MMNVDTLKAMINGSHSDRKFATELIKKNIDLITKEDMHTLILLMMDKFDAIFEDDEEGYYDGDGYYEDNEDYIKNSSCI